MAYAQKDFPSVREHMPVKGLRLLAFGGAIIACAMLTGCALGLAAPIIVDGQNFPEERTSQLHAGMAPRQVEAVLGLPLRRDRNGDQDIWKYEFKRQRKECHMVLFGRFTLEPIRTDWHQVEVAFGRAGVERVVQRRKTPEGRFEKVLVSR